jgi:serine/threonine protein phosphatase PrpC
MTRRISMMTHRGVVRRHNEDAGVVSGMVLVGSMTAPIALTASSADDVVVAVIDGMGGHAGGQQASRTIALALADRTGSYRSVLDEVQQQLYDEMDLRPELRAMGAVLAGVQLRRDVVDIFHVGDARVYTQVAGFATQLTDDDRADPQSNVLTASLGGTRDWTPLELHESRLELSHERSTRLMLCTDGLSDAVALRDIQTALDLDTPDAAVRALVAAALAAGAPDNVTVAVIDLDPEASPVVPAVVPAAPLDA